MIIYYLVLTHRKQEPDVAIVDDVVENVTPLTRSEPGQIFYHQMEAEIERGPKVYNSAKEVYDFLNARGIGKVEVIDSEIKPMLEKTRGYGSTHYQRNVIRRGS